MTEHPDVASSLARLWRAMNRAVRRPTPAARDAASGVLVPPTFVPPGHFSSPIPSMEDVEAVERAAGDGDSLAGVDLDEAQQLALLQQLAAFYPSLPFTAEGASQLRYRFENVSYSYADGILLHAMLRYLRPKRVIEVGSGHTSALILDTNELFLANAVACTFIEPHPEVLFSLLRQEDRKRTTVIASRLQDVELGLFATLEQGDILFIDSTHVSKANSDVNRLFFEILPRLAVGTMIHLHDVFPSFEYPLEWLRAGRSWNEQYLLHAFLQFNASYKVRLFGSHMIRRYPDWFRAHMPLCLVNPGGAFWMERVS